MDSPRQKPVLPASTPAGSAHAVAWRFTGLVVAMTGLSLIFAGLWIYHETNALPAPAVCIGGGLILVGLAAGAAFMVGRRFARATLAPFQALHDAVESFGPEHLSVRVASVAGRQDASGLANAINGLLDRVEGAFRQERSFTTLVANELRVPLRLLRRAAERLRGHVDGGEEGQARLQELAAHFDRYEATLEQCVTLGRTQGGFPALEPPLVETGPLFNDLARDAQVLTESCAIKFSLTRNDAGTQRLDPFLIRQLFLHLLANALEASPRGSTITAECFLANDRWHFAMADEGPGLPIDHYERVFEPFVKAEASAEAGASSGPGLGLAVCRSIAELHGGSIRARNRTDRSGLRVAVALPVRR